MHCLGFACFVQGFYKPCHWVEGIMLSPFCLSFFPKCFFFSFCKLAMLCSRLLLLFFQGCQEFCFFHVPFKSTKRVQICSAFFMRAIPFSKLLCLFKVDTHFSRLTWCSRFVMLSYRLWCFFWTFECFVQGCNVFQGVYDFFFKAVIVWEQLGELDPKITAPCAEKV